MTEHYYSNRPQSEHERQIISAEIRGKKMSLVTDAGVFSKSTIDYGSRLLIETMAFADDATVLDMGCGYGPIGIAAAMMAPRGFVTLADVNERALALAAENARRNGLDAIETVRSDLFAGLEGRFFTVIVSNPPIRAGKKVVHQLFEEARDHLVDGGELWIVIQKKQGAPSAVEKLEQLYAEVREMARSKGYRIIKAKKS